MIDERCSRRWRLLGVLTFCIPLIGCQESLHRRGEQRLGLVGSYGEPIKSAAIWSAGDGTGQNAAATIEYNKFTTDRTALLVTATPYRIYNQDDGDVYAGEFQLGLRYHFAKFELGTVPVGLYGEILGGLTYGARSVPDEGSNFNFTQDTGVGFEIQLTEEVSWINGYRLKHLSNGNLFNDDNPSQNDHFVYSGLSLRLGQ